MKPRNHSVSKGLLFETVGCFLHESLTDTNGRGLSEKF